MIDDDDDDHLEHVNEDISHLVDIENGFRHGFDPSIIRCQNMQINYKDSTPLQSINMNEPYDSTLSNHFHGTLHADSDSINSKKNMTMATYFDTAESYHSYCHMQTTNNQILNSVEFYGSHSTNQANENYAINDQRLQRANYNITENLNHLHRMNNSITASNPCSYNENDLQLNNQSSYENTSNLGMMSYGRNYLVESYQEPLHMNYNIPVEMEYIQNHHNYHNQNQQLGHYSHQNHQQSNHSQHQFSIELYYPTNNQDCNSKMYTGSDGSQMMYN